MAFKEVHPGAFVGLVISTAGAAIPFGFKSGQYSGVITNFEWALTVGFLICDLGLILRWVGWISSWGDNFLLLTSAAWVTAGVYAGLFEPTATWRYRLGFALIFLGMGVTSLFAYVREAHSAR